MQSQISLPQGGHEPPDMRGRDLPGQLDEIARRIRSLGTGRSRNPIETFFVERQTLAREAELIGDELREGGR